MICSPVCVQSESIVGDLVRVGEWWTCMVEVEGAVWSFGETKQRSDVSL